MNRILTLTVLAIALLMPTGRAPAADAFPPAEAMAKLKRYDYGAETKILRSFERWTGRASGDAKSQAALARCFAALLTDAETTHAAKVFVCGQLPLVASDAEVPVLAGLLGDAKLGDAARRALEAIEGDAAGAALRAALAQAKGMAKIGLVNSLGARRDGRASDAIAPLLRSDDAAMAAAAARALGEIGTKQSAAALQTAKHGPAIDDGLLRCAERLNEASDADAAGTIYQSLWSSKRPASIRLAALTGLAQTRPAAALPTVLEALRSDNEAVAGTARGLTARMPGPDVTVAVANELPKLSPARQAMLIAALAERGDYAAAPAVTGLLLAKDESVRLAAIRATAELGDATAVVELLALGASETGRVQIAARESLARMPGKAVTDMLLSAVGRWSSRPAGAREEAIRALVARQAAHATALLVRTAEQREEGLCVAALEALADIGAPDGYAGIVRILAAASAPNVLAAAEKAAVRVGERVEKPEKRTAPLLAAMKGAAPANTTAMLRVLGRFGGADALAAVQSRLRSDGETVRDAAVRSLAGWPDTTAADALLRIARGSDSTTHRVLAIRGLLRLAGTAEGGERVKLLGKVRKVATTEASKKMLLSALGGAASTEALAMAVAMLDEKAVRSEAALAVVKIARSIAGDHPAAVKTAAKKLLATTKNPAIVKQANALLATKKPKGKGKPKRPAAAPSAALKPDPKRSEQRKAQLRQAAPKGYRLACYVDCGPESSAGAKGGPVLRVVGARTFHWAGSEQHAHPAFGTIAFADSQVVLKVSGLDAGKTYQLGFSWWDYDHDTRTQSVRAEAGTPTRRVQLLAGTKLPSYGKRKQKPQVKTLPIPRGLSGFGSVTVTFAKEGGVNAVVSEVWLWESETTSAPAAPLPAAKATETKTDAPYVVTTGGPGAKRVLIVTGIEHHKWRLTTPVLAEIFGADTRLAVSVVEKPAFLASPELHDYDVVVLHYQDTKSPQGPGLESQRNFKRFVAEGGGLVMVHFACGAYQGWDEFVKIAGRVWNPKLRGHDKRGPFRVDITNADHPITAGMKPFDTDDELYTCLDGATPIRVLARARSKVDKKLYPIAFVLNYGKGRVFHCVLGHDVKALKPPGVRELYRRGCAWAAGLDPVPAKVTTTATATSTAQPSWTFVSMPDFLNVDTEYPQAGWEDALGYILDAVKAENPDFVLVAGDLLMGRWWSETDIEKYAAIYYPAWIRRMQAHGLKFYAAIGDHELGDNPWLDAKAKLVPLFKRKFREYLKMPLNGPEHMKGTAYYVRHRNALIVSVDVFEKAKGKQGGITAQVTGRQLEWLARVLEENRTADHVVVMGHTPVLGPVRMWSSSGLMLTGGRDSPLWRLLKKHQADLYLCGEVHAITCIERDGVQQIAHGGLIGYNTRTNYLLGRVFPDRIQLELKEIDMKPAGGKLWQVGQNRPLERVTIPDQIKKRGFVTVGRLVIEKSAGKKAFRGAVGYFEKRHEPKKAVRYRPAFRGGKGPAAPPRVSIE